MKRIFLVLLIAIPAMAQTYPRGPFGTSTDRVLNGSEVQEFRRLFQSSLNILGTDRTCDIILQYLLGAQIPSGTPEFVTVPPVLWNLAFRLNGTSISRDLYRNIALESHAQLRELGDTPYAINNLIQDATALISNVAKRQRMMLRIRQLRLTPVAVQ